MRERLAAVRQGFESFARRQRELGRWKYILATAIFLASRLVVVCGVGLGLLLPARTGGDFWYLSDPLLSPLMKWDAGWYLSIVEHGYRLPDAPGVQGVVAYYPLYPLLAYGLETLARISAPAALLLVANGFALASTLLLVRLGARRFGEPVALMAAAVFCFLPMSFFLSSGYSESTCIAFLLMSLVALEDRRFWLAAWLAGAASGVRFAGLAMAPAVALAFLVGNEKPLPKRVVLAAIVGLVACSGLLGFMVFQAWAFGNPLAFVASQQGWNHGNFLSRALAGLELKSLFDARVYDVIWFVGPLLILIFNYRYLQRDLFVAGATSLLIPYLTLGVTNSFPRYAMLCVPLYFCLGRWLRASPITAKAAFAVSMLLLVLQTAVFSRWYFVA